MALCELKEQQQQPLLHPAINVFYFFVVFVYYLFGFLKQGFCCYQVHLTFSKMLEFYLLKPVLSPNLVPYCLTDKLSLIIQPWIATDK